MEIKPNTEQYEREILIDDFGFREYDARWLYPEQLNLRGVIDLGMGIGTIIRKMHPDQPRIAVGHDYRSYSAQIKHALIIGLMSTGCEVKDIGLALSPVAYFAQFALDCPGVAMVTASHNENGWTGIKMGAERPMTFGPKLMSELKEIVKSRTFVNGGGGSYEAVDNLKSRYIEDLVRDKKISRKLKVVCACGNGTAGAYAPEALRVLGCEVIEMDCDLDYTFPKYNPNPEDLKMLHVLADRVKSENADLGFAFDGDGDRCGVVDNTGAEIFSDKVGVLLARDLGALHKDAVFVVDVKSTSLYKTDEILTSHNVTTDYWKTGHSYIKRRVNELNALAGFEKSGHFFINAPLGRGYDDGILSAILVCQLMDRNPEHTMSDIVASLPKTWSSPTMSAYCPDDKKYEVVEKAIATFTNKEQQGTALAGQHIIETNTINGIRFTLEDGSWGLIRASSNKPSLVIVVESPSSEDHMIAVFREIEAFLGTCEDVGEFDQKL